MSHPVYYVPAGDVLPIFFATYDGGTGASLTMTGLAVTDVEIYRDGGTTQRASDAGITLLDTDGIDFDTITGIHGFSIDTGDNTDAGFYTTGSWFHVVVSAITVDAQTVNLVAAAFRIMAAESSAGVPKADVSHWLGTAAATPTVAGVPEVDVTHWIGTAAATPTTAGVPEVDVTFWGGTAVGSTTVRADVINWGGVAIATPPAVNATQISGDSTAADNLELAFDDTAGAVPWVGIIDQGTAQSATATTLVLRAATPFSSDDACLGASLMVFGSTQGYWQSRLITDYTTADDTATVDTWDVTPSGTITYKVFGSAPSTATSPPTAAAIADAVWDEATAGHTTSGTFGEQLKTDVDAILVDSNALDTDWANGGRLDLLLDATLADTNELQTDWANGGRLDLILDARSSQASVDDLPTNAELATALGTADDAVLAQVALVKAKTDQLTFTVANQVDANAVSMNDVTVIGTGVLGDKWRG